MIAYDHFVTNDLLNPIHIYATAGINGLIYYWWQKKVFWHENLPTSPMKIAFGILTLILVVSSSGYVGWRLGMRDGISLACADVGMTLATYHLARQNGDAEIAERAIDFYTVNIVCHLLDGRHHFPLVNTFPYNSDYVLSQLKAVWTTPDRVSLFPTPHYYHTSLSEYDQQFSQIEASADVSYMRRYVPHE